MELLLIAAAFALLTRKSEAGQASDSSSTAPLRRADGKSSDFAPISLPDVGGPLTSQGKPCPPEWVQQVQCIKPPCPSICDEPRLDPNRKETQLVSCDITSGRFLLHEQCLNEMDPQKRLELVQQYLASETPDEKYTRMFRG